MHWFLKRRFLNVGWGATKVRKKITIFLVAILSVVVSAKCLAGEEEKIVKEVIEVPKSDDNFQYKVVTTASGLNFRVPEDMKIIKKDGVVSPEPMDQYMFGKFKKMDMKLDNLDKKLDNIQALLKTLGEQRVANSKLALASSEEPGQTIQTQESEKGNNSAVLLQT